MGLLRTAIVVAVGISLLPSDKEQQQALYQKASDATHWTLTFCDRNETTCDQADRLWTAFSAKAKFSAQLAFDMVRDSAPENGPRRLDASTSGSPLDSHGTLTPDDLRPRWRGQSASTEKY